MAKKIASKKTRVVTHKELSGIGPLPLPTKAHIRSFVKFSAACKKVYEKFSKHKIEERIAQLESESAPAITATLHFMVMMGDLVRLYGVMKFNEEISPVLYKHLDDIQEQTGQDLPLVRILLDGVKATHMEVLSGVTVRPLPAFKEPKYKTVRVKTPRPVDK